jgi:hypothetical protein
VGESVSAAAQVIQPYRGFVGAVARDKTSGRAGLGDEVRAVQAGQIPDSLFPNTCN